MRRTPRLSGALAVLATISLLAVLPAAAAPAGPAAGAAGTQDAPAGWAAWSHWLDLVAAWLGVPTPGTGREPGPERVVRGSGSELQEPGFTTQNGLTCEPGTGERDCAMDPDG